MILVNELLTDTRRTDVESKKGEKYSEAERAAAGRKRGKMSNKRGKGRARWEVGEDEVEELLRAAQDDVLLKLTLNTHLASSSSSDSGLDQELLRRFEALKLPSDSSENTSVPLPSTKPEQKPKGDHADGLGDDLFARFSALRNSSSTTKTTTGIESSEKERFEHKDEDEEDEVSKVIQWAIDEARLNPSSFSTDDEDEDEDDDEDDDEDEDEDEDKDEDVDEDKDEDEGRNDEQKQRPPSRLITSRVRI